MTLVIISSVVTFAVYNAIAYQTQHWDAPIRMVLLVIRQFDDIFCSYSLYLPLKDCLYQNFVSLYLTFNWQAEFSNIYLLMLLFSVKTMVFNQSCENLLGRVNNTYLRILQLPILLLRHFARKVSTHRPAYDIPLVSQSTRLWEQKEVLKIISFGLIL